MNKRLKFLLKIFVSLFFLVFIFHKLDFDKLSLVFSNIDVKFVFLVFFIGFINNILCGWRWWYLNNKIYNIKVPFWLTVKLYFMGGFFNLFLPTSIGGDVFKARYVYKYTGKDLSSINSIVIDRLTGLVILVAFSYIGLILAKLFQINISSQILMSLFTICIIGILGFGFLVIEYKFRILKKIPKYHIVERLFVDIKKLWENKKYFIVSTLITILFQFLTISNSYFASLALNLDIHFIYFVIIVPIVALLTMIPISFSGSGIREASYISFFAFLGIASEKIVLIPLILFFTSVFFGLLGGRFYLKENH